MRAAVFHFAQPKKITDKPCHGVWQQSKHAAEGCHVPVAKDNGHGIGNRLQSRKTNEESAFVVPVLTGVPRAKTAPGRHKGLIRAAPEQTVSLHDQPAKNQLISR